MEPVLVHHRLDRRHLGDLMPDRFGVITGEGVAAPAAWRRPALDDLAELLGRDQGAGVAAMAGLPAPLLARGGGRWPSLDRGGIGGGWPGGVGGVLAQPLLQLGDPPLEGSTSAETAACASAERVIPERLGERRLILHAAVLLSSRTQKQQWAVNAYIFLNLPTMPGFLLASPARVSSKYLAMAS